MSVCNISSDNGVKLKKVTLMKTPRTMVQILSLNLVFVTPSGLRVDLPHVNFTISLPTIMSAPPTAEQIEMLLSFLQEHQDLARGHLRDVSGRARTRELWQDLANNLNACGGTVKTVKQWQRVWADRKYLAKRAASAARQSASATGGGPSTAPPISDTDRRIISIMGEGFGSQQVEGRVPAFYSAREPASTASSSTAVPPEVASQDDVQLELPADEEHLGEIPHSAPPPQGSQPAETSSQNQSQALPARRVLRARRGLPANSLGPRIMALEEQRLNVEQRRLATEEAILDELRQLRLAIVAGIQQSRQQ